MGDRVSTTFKGKTSPITAIAGTITNVISEILKLSFTYLAICEKRIPDPIEIMSIKVPRGMKKPLRGLKKDGRWIPDTFRTRSQEKEICSSVPLKYLAMGNPIA